MPSLKRYILNIFILFFWGLSYSQDHIQFKSYTINDGLSQSTVTCIIQDQLGALWLGTQDGINRFNGKNFEVFTAYNGYNISSDFINTSFKDRKNNLWFGTANGLTKYDPLSVKFYSFFLDSASQNQIDIQSLVEDINGVLWIGTGYGEIYRFNTQKETFDLIDKQIFNSKIAAIHYLNKQLVFVSETEGILITDTEFKNKKILPYNIGENDNFIANGLVKSPYYNIVISSNRGVFYYQEETESFLPMGGAFNQLKDVNIVDFIYLSNNRILVAGEHSGLYQITLDEKDSFNIINYSADAFQKGSLVSNKLTKLFCGNQGIIWIASQQGISSFDPDHVGFKGSGIASDLKRGLPAQNVWNFDESKNQRFLYIATDLGVSCYDRTKHRYYHYNRETEGNSDFTSLTLKVIGENRLLVGCIDGLFELNISADNPENYSFTKFYHDAEVSGGFDLTYTIVPFTTENKFLIGTKAGVALFDYEHKDFLYLASDSNDDTTIGPGACRFIFKKDDQFYASPSSGGLYLIKFNDGHLSTETNHDFSLMSRVAKAYFTSAYQTNDAVFWFGTAGDGLYKYNIKTKEIVKYDKSKGLPNNVVYGVESTQQSSKYIWLSTNKGIVALNTKNDSFYSFSEKDGLMSNELNLGASFVSQNDEIYFGGIQGFNYFNSVDAFHVNNDIRVFFLGIEINNEAVFPKENGILSQSIAFTERIILPYKKRSLKLSFFIDDLSNPDKVEYKYKLSGSDNIEENLGSSNELRLTGLASGTYKLAVYARFINGEWNKYPAQLIIELESPFWQKWWFYTISLFIIFLLITYQVRSRIDESRRRQVRLEMKIAERTRELRKKNEKIKLQRNRLIKQTEELEREKEKSERLLNNILPKETVSQLKKDGRAAARDFKLVTIMFTDFVGFSKTAENMTAKELVTVLDTHFRKFDEIIDKNNLEKIKTIGDSYMCAGGVPIRNKTNPINTTLAAVQIKNYMLKHKDEQLKKGEKYWKLRIGINTGSVSAGVIGTKRYAYDIWGTAVNRAQRMEELCEPEKIAITQSTFDYIEPYFECKTVGRVKTKTGIKILMYEVVSIKQELSIDGLGIEPNDAFKKLVNLHYYSKINYIKAERFIMSKLKNELSTKLHYHSYEHSKDVTRQVERIAVGEGITDEDLFLLKTAASYHDAGFIEQYDRNEAVGARLAAEILPNFGYTENDIERIKQLIYVTLVPHSPKNKLEEIICDADLDYLGREDFHEISDKLRLELREHGKIDSDRQWDEIQIEFFKKHRYFTKTSIETRLPKKLKHLKEIKQRLKTNKYKD